MSQKEGINEQVEIKYIIEYRKKGTSPWHRWLLVPEGGNIKKLWNQTKVVGLRSSEFRLLRLVCSTIARGEGIVEEDTLFGRKKK